MGWYGYHQTAFFHAISDLIVTWLYVLPDWVGCSNLHQFGWFNLCLDQFSQGIFNLVMKIFDCVSGTYYNQNCSGDTRSRLDDLHWIGWFNLCLYQFSQGILNLVTKIFDCVCGTYYNQNCSCGRRSRLGDLLRFGWFNLCLEWFS